MLARLSEQKCAKHRLGHIAFVGQSLEQKLNTRRCVIFLFFAALPGFALADGEVISPIGYGEIQFGAKLAEIETKLKQTAVPKKRAPDCDFVRFKKYPRIRFMVEDGVVTRADAEIGIKNSAGVSIGMTISQVKELLPNIRIKRHKYDENGHYLILPTEDNRAAIVFEEGHGKITNFHAGLQPAVEYVEGCL